MFTLFLSFLLYSRLSIAVNTIHTSTNYIFVEIDDQPVPDGLTHSAANNACFTSYNTSLATIKTSEEQNEVVTLIDADIFDKWIGVQIINSSPIWLEDGNSAQPQISATWHLSGSFADNTCVIISENGRWSSRDCSTKRDYICNRYPPTLNPTINPTMNPTIPTFSPTINPTINPTTNPTINPTITPTKNPSIAPSDIPTLSPTLNPTMSSHSPSYTPTIPPTKAPTLPNGEIMEKTTNQWNKEDLSETKGDSINITLILLIIMSAILVVLIIGIFISVYCKNKRAQNIKNITEMSAAVVTKNVSPTNINMINSVSSHDTTVKNMSNREESDEGLYDNIAKTDDGTLNATPFGHTPKEEIDLENVRDSSGDNEMYENGEIEQTHGMTHGNKCTNIGD